MEMDQLLAYIDKLHPVKQEEMDDITSNFEWRKVKKREFVLQEGEVCRHNYFVLKGALRLYKVDPNGEELIRYFALENKFGTNLTSLITGTPSIEYIQAVETTELLSIHKDAFLQLLEKSPAMNMVYRNMLENAYITAQKRIYNFQGLNATDRLKWLIEESPGILTRIPSRMIASYLGITPFTLSRIKSEL